MFLAEHRAVDEKEAPAELQGTCNYCHAYSRALSWRRPKSDWLMLENMHMALFITSETTFRRALFLSRDVANPDAPEPGEIAADYLAKIAPLHTPEWSAWRARLTAPRLAGQMAGQGVGSGPRQVLRRNDDRAGAAEDEFKTSVKLKSASDGSVLARTGAEHRVRGL